MIQDKRERCIAKIISVNAYKLEAELLGNINSFNINGFEDIYQFIRLNGYVLICIENSFIVASISSIREKDNTPTYTDKNALNKIHFNKILELFPLGVLENKTFTFGVSNYPLLYSDVLYIKNTELDILFGKNNEDNEEKYLEIGSWTLMDNYNVKININEFFAFHSVILGNTGSGKSCTISAILQSIYKESMYSCSQFVFFDINGEYKQAFTKSDNEGQHKNESLKNIKFKYMSVLKKEDTIQNNESKFHLPLCLLTIDEWELLLKASAKAQIPIIRSALNLSGKSEELKDSIVALLILSVYYNETSPVAKYQKIQGLKKKFSKEKQNIDEGFNPQYGNFATSKEEEKFIAKLEEIRGKYDVLLKGYNQQGDMKIKDFLELEEYIKLSISWEEAHGNKQIRDYCSSLLTRLKSLSQREGFDIFSSDKQKEWNITTYIEYLIETTNITIIDFDTIDDEIIEIVSSVLARLFFEYQKKQQPRNFKPIHLVLDEAHRYISNNKGKEYFFEANRIFERIAREARKYGLLLMLSSQRPSELNETVVSQCSNFIIHRIQNPNDLQYIRDMTPFISKSILDQLPAIPRQEALIFGTAVHLPVLFKVKTADPLPDSKNNDIVKNWKK